MLICLLRYLITILVTSSPRHLVTFLDGTEFLSAVKSKNLTMHIMKNNTDKNPKHYPQHVLDEFDALITRKLEEAKEEFNSLSERLNELNENSRSVLVTDGSDAVA